MFQGFQDFIPKIANQLNLSKQLESSHVCTIARKILAEEYPQLNPYLTVISFNQSNKTLKMSGLNNTALNEFHYIKATFIDSINNKFPTAKTVNDIQSLIARNDN
jgi:hypothetical protein